MPQVVREILMNLEYGTHTAGCFRMLAAVWASAFLFGYLFYPFVGEFEHLFDEIVLTWLGYSQFSSGFITIP
jgi:hypothetical protein